MSYYFSDVEHSESDEESVETNNIPKNRTTIEDDEPNSYWFEFSDDENDEDKRIFLSPEQKLSEAVRTLSDSLGYLMTGTVTEIRWVEVDEKFKELCDSAEKYWLKAREMHPFFKESLETLDELLKQAQAVDENQDPVFPKKSFSDGRSFMIIRQLRKFLDETLVKIRQMEEQEATDKTAAVEDDDKPLKEEDMVEQLQSAMQQRNAVSTAEKILKLSLKQQLVYIEIPARGIIVCEGINEGSRRTTHIPIALWRKSLDHVNKIVDIVSKVAKPRLVEQQGNEISPNCTTILGNTLAGIAQELQRQLMRMLQFNPSATKEYRDCVMLENELVFLCDRLLKYYCDIKLKKARRFMAQVARCAIELIGMRSQAAHDFLFNKFPSTETFVITRDVSQSVDQLAEIMADSSA